MEEVSFLAYSPDTIEWHNYNGKWICALKFIPYCSFDEDKMRDIMKIIAKKSFIVKLEENEDMDKEN